VPLVCLTRRNPLTWAALCGFIIGINSTSGQEPVQWKIGSSFSQQLQEPVNFEWRDRVLREGLTRLSQAYGLATFLDRRIDPDQLITVSVQAQRLDQALRTVAHEAKSEMTVLGSVVYLGPTAAAQDLTTLAALRKQDIGKQNADVKSRLLRSAAMHWSELSQPQQVLKELAGQAGLRFTNLNVVSLDLWPAVSLPPLPWTDRVTLVLAGFGLTFELDERATSARLIPAPNSPLIENHYAPRGGWNELATQLRRVMPDAQIRVERDQLVVAARQEDHDKIQRLLTGQSIKTNRPAKSAGEKLYSLKVPSQPAGNVVATIAKNIGKQPRFSSAVAQKLQQNVTFEVNEVPLGQLLDTSLKPLGLTYRLSEDVLEIVEAP
jgi:hypothetical protein